MFEKKKKGLLKCTHCNERFNGFLQLAEHFDKFSIRRPFHCPADNCPWSVIGLPTLHELKRHVRNQHSVPNVKCRMGCGQVFHRVDTRNRHENNVHLNVNSRRNRAFNRRQTTSIDPLVSDGTVSENSSSTSPVNQDSNKRPPLGCKTLSEIRSLSNIPHTGKVHKKPLHLNEENKENSVHVMFKPVFPLNPLYLLADIATQRP